MSGNGTGEDNAGIQIQDSAVVQSVLSACRMALGDEEAELGFTG